MKSLPRITPSDVVSPVEGIARLSADQNRLLEQLMSGLALQGKNAAELGALHTRIAQIGDRLEWPLPPEDRRDLEEERQRTFQSIARIEKYLRRGLKTCRDLVNRILDIGLTLLAHPLIPEADKDALAGSFALIPREMISKQVWDVLIKVRPELASPKNQPNYHA